eukprot:7076269-Pyramimonas_sp.AAC.1
MPVTAIRVHTTPRSVIYHHEGRSKRKRSSNTNEVTTTPVCVPGSVGQQGVRLEPRVGWEHLFTTHPPAPRRGWVTFVFHRPTLRASA